MGEPIQGVAEARDAANISEIDRALSRQMWEGLADTPPGAASVDQLLDPKTGISKTGVVVNFSSDMTVWDGMVGGVRAYANSLKKAGDAYGDELSEKVEALEEAGDHSGIGQLYQSLVKNGSIQFGGGGSPDLDSRPGEGKGMVMQDVERMSLKDAVRALMSMGFGADGGGKGIEAAGGPNPFGKNTIRNDGLLMP